MNQKVLISMCLFAVLLSIAALCVSLVRCEPMTADWMGILVGVLSFLVTILLGWQIYALFDIREIQKEVRKSKAEMTLEAHKRLGEAHYALWAFYLNSIENREHDKELLLYACFNSGVAAIHRLALCEEYQTCGLCTKELIGLCRFLQPGENYRKLIQSQIQLLLSVENQHKVPGYAELLSALYKRL